MPNFKVDFNSVRHFAGLESSSYHSTPDPIAFERTFLQRGIDLQLARFASFGSEGKSEAELAFFVGAVDAGIGKLARDIFAVHLELQHGAKRFGVIVGALGDEIPFSIH